jgi:C-terminal processing protease CtpA/Prc
MGGARAHKFGYPCFWSFFFLWCILLMPPALADDRPWMGIYIADCRIGRDLVGVAVLGLEEGAPAREAGIVSGDIVVAVDGVALAGVDDLICRVLARRPGQHVHLTVLHDGDQLSHVVTLGMWPLNIPRGPHSCSFTTSIAIGIASSFSI